MSYVIGVDGVKFPAPQVPSSDPNTLDDYEEGTFTPGLTFGGAATGMTYSTQSGTYTKIGQLVWVSLRIQLSAKGSSTGSAAITSLPFAASSAGSGFVTTGNIYYANMSGLVDGLVALLGAAATSMNLYEGSATSVAALDDTAFTNTSDLVVTIVYRASA